MALAILGFIIIEFFPQILISLFNKSDAVLMDTTVSGIRIYLSMIILAVVQIIGASYFQSVGYPHVITSYSIHYTKLYDVAVYKCSPYKGRPLSHSTRKFCRIGILKSL